MEENILNGAEYILNAINNILTFQDFQQYKPEILKAIMDIKDTIILSLKEKQQNNSYDQNYYLQNNTNLNQSYNKNYSISNTLGLRYNYDAYLNTDSVKNSLTNTMNENETPQNYEFQNMNFENVQNYQKDNNPNNIITNIPLPQNYQQISNYKEPNINNNQNLINIQNQNFNNNFNEDNNYKINNKENINNDKQDKKTQISKVADLVMKINNDEGVYEILSKLFGENLIDKLLSRKDEKFVLGVEEAIREIEELRRKDLEDEKNINKNSININNINPLFYESGDNKNYIKSDNNTIDNNNTNKNTLNQKKSYADELLMKHGLLNPNSNFLNPISKSMKISKIIKNESERKNEPYKEFSFENSLRVGMKSRKSNIIRSNSSHINNNKKFNNYTSGYGHYFDESLQNGGKSKLTSFKQNKISSSKRNIKGNE